MESKKPFSIQERRTTKGRKVFYVQFRGPDGAYGNAVSSRQSSRAAAENWARAELEERKKTAGRPVSEWAPDITLGEWAQLFYGPDCPHVLRRTAEGQTFSPNTIRNNQTIIRLYVLPDPLCSHRLDSISRADVLAFRDRLLKSKPSSEPKPAEEGKKIHRGGVVRAAGISRTTQRAFEVFRTILREAHLRGLIASDPLLLIGRIKYEGRERGSLTPDEYRKLVTDPKVFGGDELARALFVTVALTGMRRGEVLALRWEDVDLEAAVIHIRRAFKDAKLEVEGLPKWGKTRLIPLAPAAVALLREWRKISKGVLVFAYLTGERVGDEYWKNSFARAMEKLKVGKDRGVTPHSLRHSLNSLLLAGGSAPEAVRAVLGWSDPRVQANYTHWRLELLKGQAEAVQRLAEPAKKRGGK